MASEWAKKRAGEVRLHGGDIEEDRCNRDLIADAIDAALRSGAVAGMRLAASGAREAQLETLRGPGVRALFEFRKVIDATVDEIQSATLTGEHLVALLKKVGWTDAD